jgi:hypothetical protein
MVIDDVDADGNPIKDTDAEDNEVIRKKLNPDFQQFEKEFNELLQTEKDLEYKTIKLEDFEKVETADNYITFFKLIKADDTPVVPMPAK